MIRTLLNLYPKNNEQSPVIEYFLEKQVLEQSSKTRGFISAELSMPLESGPMLVTATWEDLNAYNRWVNDPWRGQSSELLAKLLDQDLNPKTKGSIFRLIHTVSSNSPLRTT